MTVADEPRPAPGTPVRAWRAFRRWRRGRPFWGGLITMIAGVEYYFSVHLDPASISVSFGQQGFLAWLLPLVLVLCGLLAWLSPAQRIFYGIVAAATSVYGLIAVNLGGFFLGMLIGIVGGSLVAAWLPARPARAPAAVGDADDHGGTGGEPALFDRAETAVLPRADEDGADGRYAVDADGATDDTAPGRWRHRSRGAALVLVPLVVASVALLAVARPAPAYAAPSPCATARPGTPAPTVTPTTAAAPTPTPTGTGDDHGNPVGDLLGGIADGLRKLLGAGDPSPDPSAPAPDASSPAPAASTGKPAPSASCKSTTPAKPAPSTSASAAAANATLLAVPASQPKVAGVATLKADKLVMSELSYDGVSDLPKAGGGTIQALRFSMGSAVQTPFELDVPASSGRQIVQTSSQLTISGNVAFYCTSFSGVLNLLGIPTVRLTFTPDAPPPITLSQMTFTDVRILLVYVHADKLEAKDFGNRSRA